MTYSLFFQVADVFAAPLQGILRGYKDTKVPFYLGVLAYWGITFPVGFLLEKVTGLGPYSYWIGLIASLIVSGLCYQWRLNRIVKRYESQLWYPWSSLVRLLFLCSNPDYTEKKPPAYWKQIDCYQYTESLFWWVINYIQIFLTYYQTGCINENIDV